jgi:integrase
MLTAKKIDVLRKQPGRYLDGGDLGRGLYLQVGRYDKAQKRMVLSGGASWLLRYERDGRERWMGLGSLSDFSLKLARIRAQAQRQKLADGIDPLNAKAEAKAAAKALADKNIIFEKAARKYFAEHQAKWRSDTHRKQFLSTLAQYAFPLIGKMPVADIGIAQVLKVLEQEKSGQRFWDTRRVTADRVRGRIESILDWCAVRGHRSGDNPARWKGYLDNVLPGRSKKEVQHKPALPYADVGRFMIDLRKRKGAAARALEFTVLTGARSGETLGARWNEFDLTEKVWTVPADRIKAGVEHRQPLTDAALKILHALPRKDGNALVFNIDDKDVMAELMQEMAYPSSTANKFSTVHGFRSTFRTWASDKTSFASEVRKKAIAHLVGDETERSYDRGDLFDKRRELMTVWADYCAMPPVDKNAKVIPIRKGRK